MSSTAPGQMVRIEFLSGTTVVWIDPVRNELVADSKPRAGDIWVFESQGVRQHPSLPDIQIWTLVDRDDGDQIAYVWAGPGYATATPVTVYTKDPFTPLQHPLRAPTPR